MGSIVRTFEKILGPWIGQGVFGSKKPVGSKRRYVIYVKSPPSNISGCMSLWRSTISN
jgi:hypothetical protein